MDYEIIIRFVLDLLIIVLVLYSIFWKSYFNEKGKNLATKKDIEAITIKIEKVKNEVSLHSQQRLAYANDKKMAAINFISSISVWIDYSFRPLDRIMNNPTNLKLLSSLIADMKNKGSVATSSLWNLLIYYGDDLMIKSANNLYTSCTELHNLTNDMLINIETNASKIANSRAVFDSVNSKEERKISIDEIGKLMVGINEFISTYNNKYAKIEDVIIHNRIELIVILNKSLKIKAPIIGKKKDSSKAVNNKT